MERELKNSICFVAGKERKPLSSGISVPWHFHVLMAAHCPIPQEQVELWWRQIVGRQNAGNSGDDDSVLVEPMTRT
jgi:hypothetical protein